jgi:hypothetical protein
MPLALMDTGVEDLIEVEADVDLITILEIKHVKFASNGVIMLPIAIIGLTYDIMAHLLLKIQLLYNIKPFLLSQCFQLLIFLP